MSETGQKQNVVAVVSAHGELLLVSDTHSQGCGSLVTLGSLPEHVLAPIS
jgi:hypothetical protein